MVNLISSLSKSLAKFVLGILDFLPNSPFGELIEQLGSFDFLPFINWFIPFDFCLTVLNVWLLCVAVYYAYQNGLLIVRAMKIFK